MTPPDLRQMIEAATPGPLIAVPGSADYLVGRQRTAESSKWETATLAHYTLESLVAACPYLPPEKDGRANARLIAALVNQAPAILALWEAAQAVTWYEWARNNNIHSEAVADIEKLRTALAAMQR